MTKEVFVPRWSLFVGHLLRVDESFFWIAFVNGQFIVIASLHRVPTADARQHRVERIAAWIMHDGLRR